MILNTLLLGTNYVGYIAGTADGIVTAGGEPAARDIVLFDADGLTVVSRNASIKTGRYLFSGLNPNTKYLVILRDHQMQFEPFAYDYVKPATDLTVAEQKTLWQSWQT